MSSDTSGAKKRASAKTFTTQEKCEAVLSLWSERRTITELCRELSVSYMQLAKWQTSALEGMIQSLTPKRKARDLSPRLNPRLTKLLERRLSPGPPEASKRSSRLGRRMQTLQEGEKA